MEVKQEWRDWNLALKNLVFPIFCKICGERLLTDENGFFCPRCWESSPRIERPFCPLCGRPHAGLVGIGSQSNFPCADCRARPHPHIRRVYGAAEFDGAVALGIKLFKFYGRERMVKPLTDLLKDYIRREMDPEAYDVLVPVPLHRVRERSRGYNQSRLLAQGVLGEFSGASLDESLRRIRPTRTQSLLTGPVREANIRGAFAVMGYSLTGKGVLLVDDVVTTGGTVQECARVLHRAGVKWVDVLAVALTVSGLQPNDKT
ncbi:MAG TPA: ComF family protein [Candidatus Hydrogenedentes bacterium]|nr:ComF family protein [Candidatus Hydrogenedentota bacterium]